MRKKILPPSHELLISLYVEQRLHIDEVCARIGCSRTSTYAFLRQYGITRPLQVNERSKNPITYEDFSIPDSLNRYHRIPGKEWLEERYLKDNLSVTDIGLLLGVNRNSVTKALHRYGIPIKPHYMAWQGRSNHENTKFRHSIRKKIFARDHFTCCLCETAENLEVHHIIPKRLGGKNTIDNGITLCEACHAKIGRQEAEWIGPLLEARNKHTKG